MLELPLSCLTPATRLAGGPFCAHNERVGAGYVLDRTKPGIGRAGNDCYSIAFLASSVSRLFSATRSCLLFSGMVGFSSAAVRLSTRTEVLFEPQ